MIPEDDDIQPDAYTKLTTMYEKRIADRDRKVYDFKNLINLGISLSSNLDFESLVESILYSCIGQIFVEKVVILLQIDIDVSSYYIHMAKGYDEQVISHDLLFDNNSPFVNHFLVKPGAASESKSELKSEAYHIDELHQVEELRDDIDKIIHLEPKIVVPMKSKNLMNGFILLGEKLTGEEYSSDEKEFLTYLAKFAAIAVENSRLYLMATLDRMTRLYIHHYFQERLHDEMKRSERQGTPLCLIMSDIDHFKKFNDTYGHQQGDIVLKEVAKLYKKLVRGSDIPARYGGEEFAIILPGTELNGAIEIASRLRKTIELHEFPGQADPLHVTISLGIAQYNPEIDKEKKDLVERADSALYKAKESGRNRVVAHKSQGQV